MYYLQLQHINKMGNLCCREAPAPTRTVTYLSNSLPVEPRFQLVENESIRFSEVSVRKAERNIYLFSMGIKDQVDIHAEIPVLNEIVHCITCENYELDISSRAIVDAFSRKYSQGLMEVKNLKTGLQFSMKVVPFKSYTNYSFKEAFYELWINQKVGSRSNFTVKLLDYFIFGLHSEMQAFVFLFEKCSTSLANVAEYRQEANMPWNDHEKLKIIMQILQSYQSLHDKNIVHRDLRPSNIYYCAATGKFNIGNFSKARLLRRNHDSDLMTVCGVPYYSCQEMETLIQHSQSIGFYEGLAQDYNGLKSIINLIESCDLFDQHPTYKSPHVRHLQDLLSSQQDYKAIMGEARRIVGELSVDLDIEIGDRQITQNCSFLLAHTHKTLIEKWVFETYGHLGYHKEFSGKAHRILEMNNQNDRELDNAPILRRLGEFYESKGSKGTEYFYNAFVLYIKRAEKSLKYGYPQKAEQELDSARETYLKFNRTFQSELPRIEINRMVALLQKQNNNQAEAVRIMNQTFVKAAQENIPVEKQCRILLAYGQIFKQKSDTRDQAMKKLATGLTICQNGTSFESPSSCRIYKSNFLFEIGSLYISEMLAKHNPKKHREEQAYGIQLKAKAETHLRSALQIRQKQSVDDLDVAECLEQLGLLYYNDENFYDSKKFFERALIRLNHLKDQINPRKKIHVLYMKGSSSYYLSQFSQAKRDYETALRLIGKIQNKRHNLLLGYNIEGNLALALIQMGEPEGKQLLDSALQKIKQMEGDRSYDYACLKLAYQRIKKY